MPADASRFPEGIVINGVITTARPVGTIVRDTVTGVLNISTSAAVATYTALTGRGGVTTVIADPGTGVAIPVDQSGSISIVTAAAETNTLAIPSFLGQELSLNMDVRAVGDRVITASVAINAAANTIMTFGVAGDAIQLIAVQIAGALVWRISGNEGVALS